MSEFESWKAMEAAEYLNRVRRSCIDIKRLQDEVETQRSLLMPGTDYGMKVQSSVHHDRMEQAAIRIMEMEEQYTSELFEWIDLQREAHDAVKKMADSRHRAVLTLYYLDGHSWETVADRIGYEWNYCRELRTQALPLFWDVMPKDAKTMLPRAD